MMEYPVFEFDFKKCEEYANKVESTAEAIDYWNYCIIKARHAPRKVIDRSKQPFYSNPNNYIDNFIEACKDKVGCLEEIADLEFYANSRKKFNERSDKRESHEGTSKDQSGKIPWQGSEVQLIYLIKLLVKKGFLHSHLNDEIFAFIEKHFENKDGKPYKQKQLSQSHYQYSISKTRKPKKAKLLEEITETIEQIEKK